MKVRRVEQKGAFVPFTLEIDVNDAETARALHAIFNYHHNTRLFAGGYGIAEEIREAIGAEHYADGHNQPIANGYKYQDFYVNQGD